MINNIDIELSYFRSGGTLDAIRYALDSAEPDNNVLLVTPNADDVLSIVRLLGLSLKDANHVHVVSPVTFVSNQFNLDLKQKKLIVVIDNFYLYHSSLRGQVCQQSQKLSQKFDIDFRIFSSLKVKLPINVIKALREIHNLSDFSRKMIMINPDGCDYSVLVYVTRDLFLSSELTRIYINPHSEGRKKVFLENSIDVFRFMEDPERYQELKEINNFVTTNTSSLEYMKDFPHVDEESADCPVLTPMSQKKVHKMFSNCNTKKKCPSRKFVSESFIAGLKNAAKKA